MADEEERGYQRPPPVSADWGIADWEDYRERVLRVRDLPNQDAWWELTGVRCMRMADRAIARLRTSKAADG